VTSPSPGASGSVLALIVTHDSPATLRETVAGVLAQSTRPGGVLVVDNASEPTASVSLVDVLADHEGYLRVVRSEVNSGPAGGWAMALEEFLESGSDLAWLLDDDIVAPPPCLETLLEECAVQGSAFVIPSVRQPGGQVTTYPAWHGVLLGREVVAAAGMPRSDFFWWSEDTEYLMWRIPAAGWPLRFCRRVVVEHRKGRGGLGTPPWKYYYEVRNSLYFHLYLRRGRGSWPRTMALLAGRLVLREHQDRAVCARLALRGAVDGVLGRMGKRVNPEDFPRARLS